MARCSQPTSHKWTSVDYDLRFHMASRGHNLLTCISWIMSASASEALIHPQSPHPPPHPHPPHPHPTPPPPPHPHSAAYMLQRNWSALVQIMDCHFFGAKPISKTMLGNCQCDPWEQNAVKFHTYTRFFHSWTCIFKASSTKRRPSCPGEDELM